MILYFSGSGNSLSIARRLPEKLNKRVVSLREAVPIDLSKEKRIGLVYPHFCPHQAMEISHKPTPMESQYHHPDIQLRDMVRK